MARRRTRRTLAKGSTAWAAATAGDGRTLSWESLSGAEVTPVRVDLGFNNLAHSSGTVQTRYMTTLSQELTRGAVTLERVRGYLKFWFLNTDVNEQLSQWVVECSMQLVPIQDGSIVDEAVLSLRNSGDLESNRIFWRRAWHPYANTLMTGPGAKQYLRGDLNEVEVDVKSRRRFDRSKFAILLTIDVEAAIITELLVSTNLRALFRAPDGL